MLPKLTTICALALLAVTPAKADIYPWSTTATGHIDGDITGIAYAQVVLVSYTPPTFLSEDAFTAQIYRISTHSNPLGFDAGDFYWTISATSFSFDSHPFEIADDARDIVQWHYPDSRSQGFMDPTLVFGLLLPDGLSLDGADPIASAVPEPSTWTMLLVGFAGLGFMTHRRRSRRIFEDARSAA